MLTFIKEILTWWNRQTLGTRLHTFFLESLLEDKFGNKYYENKKRKKDGLFTMEKLMQLKFL